MLEREASSSDYEPNLSQLSRLELSTPPSSPELRNGSPPAPTSPRPVSPSSPKHRMLQDSARRPSVGRLLVNDCPVPGDSDADNAPPKTGLDLPLIWTAPTLPVHDSEEPPDLLPVLSSAERDALAAAYRTAEESHVVRRLVFEVDGRSDVSSAPSTPQSAAAPLPAWCRGSLAPGGTAGAGTQRPVGWQASLPPFYDASAPDDETLVFESRFESGNLRRAWQVGPREYELDLYADRSTDLHTRWFYFSVSNTRAGVPYTFSVVNMSVTAYRSMYHAGTPAGVQGPLEPRPISPPGGFRSSARSPAPQNTVSAARPHAPRLSAHAGRRVRRGEAHRSCHVSQGCSRRRSPPPRTRRGARGGSAPAPACSTTPTDGGGGAARAAPSTRYVSCSPLSSITTRARPAPATLRNSRCVSRTRLAQI